MNISQITPAVPMGQITGPKPALPQDSGAPPTESLPAADAGLMGTLGEIEASPPSVDDGNSGNDGSSVLSSGSGGVPIKMAASIYVLNHSFDEQKSVLELIA